MTAKIFDTVVFAFCGAIFVSIFVQPSTVQQAIAAGLGWTGLVGAIGRKKEEGNA